MKLPAEDFAFSTIAGKNAAQVLAFQAAVYREQYGQIPDDGLDSRADFLIARDSLGKVAASARVLTSERRPFTFETAVDFSRLEHVGNSPAEIGRWCIRQDLRDIASSRGLLFGMMKLVHLFGRSRAVSTYLIYVYPELERFYRGLYFEDTGFQFDHPAWGTVRMLALSLDRLDSRLCSSKTSLADYLLAPPGPNFVIGAP